MPRKSTTSTTHFNAEVDQGQSFCATVANRFWLFFAAVVYRFTHRVHRPSGLQLAKPWFWSLTMYDDQNFLAANPLNRYTLSQRDKFVTNPDGSVDIFLQADSPGKAKEPNWLPDTERQIRYYAAALLADRDTAFYS